MDMATEIAARGPPRVRGRREAWWEDGRAGEAEMAAVVSGGESRGHDTQRKAAGIPGSAAGAGIPAVSRREAGGRGIGGSVNKFDSFCAEFDGFGQVQI
jgi:hypothetical protein